LNKGDAMSVNQSELEIVKSMEKLNTALFELRDALIGLSLSINDRQFVHDDKKRHAIEKEFQQLIQKIGSCQIDGSF
jgi:uncharacterized protein YlxW (UPF0749 family)